MKNIVIISIIFILSACDQPALNRTNAYIDPYKASGLVTNNSTDNFEETSNLGPGYENCNLNNTANSKFGGISNFSICKSTNQPSSTEVNFKVKFGDQDYVHGTCFIPLHKTANNQTTYVGIAQCTYHAANDVLAGSLIKNRPGYTNYNINSVMVIKKNDLDAYFQCMDASATYMATQSVNINGQTIPCTIAYNQNNICNAGQVNYMACSTCTANANNTMNNLCNTFMQAKDYHIWNF